MITRTVLFCSSLNEGQVALTANSFQESCSDVIILLIFLSLCTGTRIRTLINGFGDRYSTIELCPYVGRKAPPTGRHLNYQLSNRVLLDDFSYLTRTNGTTTFTDCETQTIVYSNICDQFNSDAQVISRHYHFNTVW